MTTLSRDATSSSHRVIKKSGCRVQRYQNISANSGVIAYELRPNSIIVQFQDGWKYEYSNDSVGPSMLRDMKRLAGRGQGLSTFISQSVREAYERKYR